MASRSHGEFSEPRNKFIHQVFLSFRGEDVRNGFVGHLFNGLRREGFRVFMDNDGLEHGMDIQIKLLEAIEQSKVSIVTLSPRYADSRWCLDELTRIIKLNASPDRFVLPVFLDMEPTDVRHQTGLYGTYFEAHVKRLQGEMDRVDSWRWALKEVAALKGPSLKDANRNEAQLIQNIIKEVGKMLPIQKLALPPNIIGVDSVVRDICNWIQDGSQDVGVGVIHGQGGIGKTTIAQIAFNVNFNDFDGSSFLEDIARVSKQDNGMIRLQRKLISDILGYKVGEIYSASEGMAKIRDVIGSKRILLVLDDVEEMEHLGGLFDHPEWFCPGSKIIITIRNRQLQKKIHLFQREFKVNKLNKKESTELFSLLVFNQALPLKGYEEVSYKFVEYSGGLPLALRILGHLLCGEEDIEIWEDNLQKLEKGCGVYTKIHVVLKLSFDSLEDEDDRNLFLHIAIFFIGRDEEYAFKILKACGVYTKAGFQNLVNRCLVSVSGKRLMMHQLIQEMGREIVRQESVNEPGLRSRLWDHKETLYMLQKNKGTASVKGLKLAFPAPKSVTFKENHIQPVSSGIGLASILSPTPLRRVASNLESIQTDAFAKLENLNLLELSYVQLKGGYVDFPKEIKWLQWRGCPLKSIPEDLELYEMAVLDMQNSRLIKAWEDNKLLRALRILNLSHSLCLRSTPDLSNANGLEWIILEGCINLVKIHDSIGSLRNLYNLNLKGCKNLRRLPYTIDKLDSIKRVNLSGCCLLFIPPNLMESSIILAGNMNQKVSQLPVDILSSPFSSINLFPFIVKLNLNDCGISHDDVFDSLSGLSSLKKLYLDGNPIRSIRKDLRTLPRLRILILGWCKHLRSISQLPGRVRLYVDNCPSLERIEYQKNPYAEDGYVRAFDCPKLVAVENVLMLEHITKLDADKAKYIGYSKLESFQSSTLLAGGGFDNGLSKGVYHCGIYSIFLDGDHLLEDWFTVTNLGSEILYTVPRLPDHPIRAFNVCCVFECGSEIECGSYIRSRGRLQIENLTTMSKWLHYPAVFPLHFRLHKGTEITWLTHWSVMLHRDVRVGDELEVSFKWCVDVPIKCGINIVYEVDEEDTDIETSNPYPIMSDNCLASVYHDIFRIVDLSEFERQDNCLASEDAARGRK
ncbi:hypothetical protein QQ045_023040 [Rhodiola kirilowii]